MNHPENEPLRANPPSPMQRSKHNYSPTSALQVPRPPYPEIPSQEPTPLQISIPLHMISSSEQDSPRFPDPPTPTTSPPLLYHTTQTLDDPTILVWDVEDNGMDNRVSLQEPRSRPLTPHIPGQIEGVFKTLNALYADWQITAPWTAQIMIAQYAEILHLDISLETAVTREGLKELQNEGIPAVICLLSTIRETMINGMTNSTATENAEDPERGPPSVDGFTVDIGESEGPRTFFFVGREPEFHGEWMIRQQSFSNVDVRA
ncbi:hypothetical protein Moror_9243 [Moniliophthora roreri MCA 2997]|uniref:Uncharacterized protein n=1 Tax=Moniliophthora roreri (strain MCA 2997) TaxID=1381753 RepID=V2WTM4_MONRO|nr:hypothetical protein Moror_9243 [Moniliophthora roreri MCA 2997]